MYEEITPESSERWWDWPAAVLLLATLLTAAARLNATHWAEHLSFVQTVALLGGLAGLALGQSQFSPSVVRFFGFVYGLFTIGLQIGLTLGRGVPWPERLVSVGNRLLIILDDIFRQKPVSDNLFFISIMAILFWTLSCYAGYVLMRHGYPWQAILPAGFALVIIHIYDSFFAIRTWFLAGFIFLSLLLVTRMHFLHQHKRWRQNGTYLPPFVGMDSIRLGLMTTAILVIFAWTMPALAQALPPAEQVWGRATQPWTAFRERMSNALASLQSSVGFVTDLYGDTLPLGRGNPLTDTVIMSVEAPPQAEAGVRYYWRARVYDTYDGSWSSTLTETRSLNPDAFLEFPEYQGRSTGEFTIKTLYPLQNLNTPAQPLWVSRPVEAQIALNPDGTIDLGNFKAKPLLRAGDVYQVKASLTSATVADLRNAGQDYPSWVTDRYLQLPETITPKTRQLAAQIASGLDNPYDITQAVTDYLRSNLVYNETVPPVPNGQEPIDWILFDHRQAFCNYYATAEVILLRSLGIPSRLAVGYAEGERSTPPRPENIPILPSGAVPEEATVTSGIYTVRHRDAHAWPEVFFPNIGWVEFEPTVSQQPIIRPTGNILNPEENPAIPNQGQDPLNRELNNPDASAGQGELPPEGPIGLLQRIPLAYLLLILAVVIAIILFLVGRIRRKRGYPPFPVQFEARLRRMGLEPPATLRRWARSAALSPLARAYLELNRALSRLGWPPVTTDTPAERAAVLEGLLPVAEKPIRSLLFEYQAATYGERAGDAGVAQQAGKEIRNTSYLALLQRVFARFQERPKGRRRSNDRQNR